MGKRIVICISRESGSGGRLVGERMAAKLGIHCYAKNLIHRTAVEYGLDEDIIAGADEMPASFSTIGFPMGIRNPYKADYETMYYTLNDKMFILQSKTIKAIASEGSCIFIGRAADEILKDDPDMISIFIHARKEDRIRRDC